MRTETTDIKAKNAVHSYPPNPDSCALRTGAIESYPTQVYLTEWSISDDELSICVSSTPTAKRQVDHT